MHRGHLDGTRLVLELEAVHTTPTAKSVVAVTRELEVAGDTMSYTLDMAAVGEPMTFHCAASLTRSED